MAATPAASAFPLAESAAASLRIGPAPGTVVGYDSRGGKNVAAVPPGSLLDARA
ncbi:hypothetical protein [Cohnella xylanilytica]|uniref:hypothetical protein n=1 Tax=Cohnella xylanilytica TaxID=557555 RepID=UPI001BB3B7E1|nr:hypothetical protein [Cohnella xylanilytica]